MRTATRTFCHRDFHGIAFRPGELAESHPAPVVCAGAAIVALLACIVQTERQLLWQPETLFATPLRHQKQ